MKYYEPMNKLASSIFAYHDDHAFSDMAIFWNTFRTTYIFGVDDSHHWRCAMTLVHPPIRSRSKNKRRNLWVGWCVSFWWPWFWPVYPIYYYTHTMYHSCILSDWNRLFLRHIYIPRVGVAMTGCRVIPHYYYSFLLGVKCIFQLYSSGFSIL